MVEPKNPILLNGGPAGTPSLMTRRCAMAPIVSTTSKTLLEQFLVSVYTGFSNLQWKLLSSKNLQET
jgi:hypothetical protein